MSLDTIAAISTGCPGAIGIVRISGDKTAQIVHGIFRETSGRKISDFLPRKLYFGTFHDTNGDVIDHGLCTISRAPASYTGEDTAEFHLHGSSVLLSLALDTICAAGARLAEPGEFTRRAFLHGRLDLMQAEAVVDLIDAQSPLAAKNAAGQLARALSDQIEQVAEKLSSILAHFHASAPRARRAMPGLFAHL